MTDITRRDLTATALLLGTLAAAGGGTRALAQSPAPPMMSDEELLAHVNPELRDAARVALGWRKGPPLSETYRSIRQQAGPAPKLLADVPVTSHTIAAGAGIPDVTIYVINAGGERRPAILHTHGGGFVLGRARDEIPAKQQIAKALGCVIVTVDYALAPEATYRVSVPQNYAALKWLHDHADTLGVDRQRIAVMGESAGGGHAALLAIVARDRGEVPLAFQCLVYPMLDDRTGSTVGPRPPIGAMAWDVPANVFGWRSFLGQAPGTAGVPPAAVPARTASLAGLPPAFIGVGSIDLFVDEDIVYARRLIDAGIATELHIVPGAFHGFDGAAAEAPIARAFTLAKMNALRRAFGEAPVPA
ncbi:MAG: alpha/beta hydrolase [Sphingomonas sp.]